MSASLLFCIYDNLQYLGKLKKAEKREKALLAANQEVKQLGEQTKLNNLETEQHNDMQGSKYSISLAIPGSFLNNAQNAELRTYMAGQIARAATLFCVEDIIIYDDTCKMTNEHVNAYWSGKWMGETAPSDSNFRHVNAYWSGKWMGETAPSDSNFEACFYLARILEYLECPQYLRKYLFPIQKPLRFAGILHPLDAQHHLRSDDLSIPFREGIILNKPVKDGRGLLCDIGLDKANDRIPLPAGTRVTVEVNNFGTDSKRYRGKLSSARKVYEQCGKYWGYTVKLATSLRDAINRRNFDLIIGTSSRGEPVSSIFIDTMNYSRILLIFGSISGVDAAVEADETLAESCAEEAFDFLVNPLPQKGTESERVEESVLITLAEITLRLQQLSS
ncbi:hypothetical protein DICVIV_00629 [Dictyocaulus viviparus]|uniref:Uncharacterized protein n=1 Tax=Dictyocaulus viviparus TaxID=29172 RepID=A0A0D8YEQ3_DICVI|nr:hypothetical protein DICVIV_00629 [Dictyocaulus viviparus]